MTMKDEVRKILREDRDANGCGVLLGRLHSLVDAKFANEKDGVTVEKTLKELIEAKEVEEATTSEGAVFYRLKG